MAWLQLIRLPAVFTALPDVVAGYVIIVWASSDRFHPSHAWPLLALVAASGLLYMSGMVFNDCFDAEDDARARPERPIPSGRIGLKAAFVFGMLLMAGGLGCAMLAGKIPVYVAGVLASAIWLYDGLLKLKWLTACLGMALCRFLNMLLGMSLLSETLLLKLPAYDAEVLGPPLLLAFYVASVTMISRVEDSGEAAEGAPGGGRTRAVLVLGAAGFAATLVLAVLALPSWANVYALAVLAVLAVMLLKRVLQALRTLEAEHIRLVVRTGLLGIILLDAALIFGHAGVGELVNFWSYGHGWAMGLGAGVLALLAPAMLAGRLIRLT